MLRNYVCFALLLLTASMQAQDSGWVFKNFDTQDGLCDNYINSILEDSRGMIWIATREGLSRYDGAQFKNYYTDGKERHALKGNLTSCLIPYNKDTLLLLNNNRPTLLRISDNQFIPIRQFEKYVVNYIEILKPGWFVFTTADEILLVNQQFEIVQSVTSQSVRFPIQLKWLSGNDYLVNNYRGLYHYNNQSKRYTPFLFPFVKPPVHQTPNYVIQHLDYQKKLIYLSEYWTGLYVFTFDGQLVHRYYNRDPKDPIPSNFITNLLFTKDNKLWITTDRGLALADENTYTVKNSYHSDNDKLSLKSNTVLLSYEDSHKNIWIGTDQGLSVYKNLSHSFVQKTALPVAPKSNDMVTSIALEGNSVYAGCYLSDTYKVNTQTSTIEKLAHTPGAWSVQNYNGTITITGSGNTITEYNPANNAYRHLAFLKPYFPTSDIIVMSFKQSNGDLWYSGNNGGGLVRVEAKTNTITHYRNVVNGKRVFDSSYYPYVAEDSRGDLWFGVNKSSTLLHWRKTSQTFEELKFSLFSPEKNTNFGGINHLVCDTDDILWIAYDGNGLVSYHTRTGHSKLYTLENGLPTNYIGQLQFDTKKRLWMLTAKGLYCFIPKQNKIVQLSIWDGFADNPVNYNVLKMDTAKNQMWLGAVNCMYRFNPDEIIRNKSAKGKLFLDDIKVNNIHYSPVNPTGNTFRPDDNNIQFDIVAIDIENGKNIEYSYKLDGFDPNWVLIGSSRTVVFPKLKSGTYSFYARARYRGSNEWFYLAKPLVFTIQTHWYLTWWCKATALILLVCLIWLLIYFNFRKQLEKQKAVEEERNRIAADMHDDLGSGLTKITYLSQMALQKDNNKELLSGIKTTSTQLVESMSEIIWAMKEENNTWEELLSYIKLYAQEYGQNNGLQVHFIFPEGDMSFAILGEVRRHIFLSVKECLHNIVKHAAANNISIHIEKHTHHIDINIQDDGKGIDKDVEKTLGGNGLKNIALRMTKINGTFTLLHNQGTTIRLRIPC